MATWYWVAKNAGWSGPTGAGTETSPFWGAIAVRNALGSTILANDRVIFMGEYGPVTMAELNADWPIGSAYTISTAIGAPAGALQGPTDTVNFRGGILFGSASGTTSNASNIEFIFRGTNVGSPWHIDARGATTAAQRMMAAITFQGYRVKVTGCRAAAPDWDYTITNGRIPASATFPSDVSRENYAIHVWGGVGAVVDGCTAWGSNAFSRTALLVSYSMTVGQSASGNDTLTEVKNCIAYGAQQQIQVIAEGLLVPTGTTPDRLRFGNRAILDVHHNVCHTARWGDNLATPAVNNALYHGGHILVNFFGSMGSLIKIRDNDTYGTCQDSIEAINYGGEVFDNYVHDLNPGKTTADTFMHYAHSAGNWVATPNNYIGDGIKLALPGSGSEIDGTVTAAPWLSLGTVGGGYNIDAGRNAVYRNRIINPTNYGITTNGGGGMMIAFNEAYGGTRGCLLGGINTSKRQQQWVANNYFRGSVHGLTVGSRNDAFLYNNILRGGSGSDLDGAASTLPLAYGDNNILHNGVVNFGGGTNLLTGTISANAAYVEGIGPSPGGNCDAKGMPFGLEGMRAPSRVTRDLARNYVDMSRPPIGPRRAR